MPRVTAIQPVFYAGKDYKPGQRFDAEAHHAEILAKVGKVKVIEAAPRRAKEPRAAPPVGQQSAPETPEAVSQPASAAEAPHAPHTYQRRDLLAED